MFSKTALSLWPVGVALLAGAGIPFQAASNAAVGRALGHPFWGAITSLLISAMVILPLLGAQRASAPTISTALQGPWWLWVGGIFGAVYVSGAAAVTPKLGAAGFLVCVVAGQMVVAMVVDHFGWMGIAPKPVTLLRLAGVALILGGALLVHLASAKQPEPGQPAGTTPTDWPQAGNASWQRPSNIRHAVHTEISRNRSASDV